MLVWQICFSEYNKPPIVVYRKASDIKSNGEEICFCVQGKADTFFLPS